MERGVRRVVGDRGAFESGMSIEELLDMRMSIRNRADTPVVHAAGPPPTPVDAMSPSHPAQRPRWRTGWFPGFQFLRRRRREASQSSVVTSIPSRPSGEVPELSANGSPALSLERTQSGLERFLSDGERNSNDSSFSSRLAGRIALARAAQHLTESDDMEDLWLGLSLEDDARDLEAAMEHIIMDGLAGALQARNRWRQHAWLAEDEQSWTYEDLLELDRHNVRRGLKAKEMNQLERRRQTSLEAKMDCQICLMETCTGDLLTSLPCSHSYHDSCITPWLQSHRTCPVCRKEIPEAIVDLTLCEEQ